MNANPADFEAIGTRLGFHIATETAEKIQLIWQGTRFPAFLCLGIALLLLFVSVPILQAIHQRGFAGPAGSLWYFPFMNLILFGIALYLLSQKRTIVLDDKERRLTFSKRNLHKTIRLSLSYGDIRALRLGLDRVSSGFAVAGSTGAQTFPTPALRLFLDNGETVLMDRGSKRRLQELGKRIGARLGKPLEVDPEVQS